MSQKKQLLNIQDLENRKLEDDQITEKILNQSSLLAKINTIKMLFEDDDPEFWTEEQKENFNYLSKKLEKEWIEENQKDDQLKTTIEGNPSNPTGEAGRKMVERMNNSHKGLTNWGLDHLKLENPEAILDIGCGGGAAIANLHERYPEAIVYGIDISEVSVEKSLEYNEKAVKEGKVKVSLGNVEDLPFPDNFFDLIISVESYFFWPDFQKALNQIFRVLKSNGTLLLMAEMYKGMKMNPVEEMMKEELNLSLYSEEEFKDYLEKAGFSNIKIEIVKEKNWISVKAQKL